MPEKDANLEIYRELIDQVGSGASAGGTVAQTAFTQFFCEFLTEKAHYISDLTPAYFFKKWKTANVRVDAYYLDEQTHDLTLVVSDFSDAEEPEQIGLPDARKAFEQVRRFYRASMVKEFRQGLEDTDEVRPLAQLIYENQKLITRVRYVLVTNKSLGSRVKDDAFDELKSSSDNSQVQSEFTVWDFFRYAETVSSANPPAEIEVDCTKHSPEGKGLPFLTSPDAGLLPGQNGQREYSAYLLMVPGKCVYDWYAQYADRLLEQNVRTFLQFKGKVNRGIRATIQTEPNRFLAYNNGLTATADEIELDATKTRIIKIKNLQIVNGGQTTASIYTAFNTVEANLDAIAVQMKLIVASGAQVEDLVGKISRFANSQNKIKDTDLASNQRFMLRMEYFSRHMTANPGGTLHGTRWFFERTRGQYANAINVLKTESERTKFKKLYPKDQVFTKSDLAKYILSWDWSPWIVAKGAEKAFVEFERRRFGSDADFLPGNEKVEQWRFKDADGNPQFCEYYYQEAIGKAILYHTLDKQLRSCEWCKGFKSYVIVYTISLFHWIVYCNQRVFNFPPLWSEQAAPLALVEYLIGLSQRLHRFMVTAAKGRNIIEWARTPELWMLAKQEFRRDNLPLNLPQFFVPADIVSKARQQSADKQSKENEKLFWQLVLVTEDELWNEMHKWLEINSAAIKMSHVQNEALQTRMLCKNAMTPVLSRKLILLWQQSYKAGFPYPPPSEAE